MTNDEKSKSFRIITLGCKVNQYESAYLRDSLVDAGWRDYLWGMNDPLLESLHSDQTFKDMMDSVQRMVAGMRDKVREMESQ